MNTRGRPDGKTQPSPSLLLSGTEANTLMIKEQLYTPELSEEEMYLEEEEMDSDEEQRCWMEWTLSEEAMKYWYEIERRIIMGWHRLDRLQLLELPGEIRNEIYKYVFPLYLGLFPSGLEGTSIGLLLVNKQVYEEVMSLIYGTKPLRLIYERGNLNIDTHLYDWDNQIRFVGRNSDTSIFRRFLDGNAVQYINEIEISLSLEYSSADYSNLLEFFDKLYAKRRTELRRLTIQFTAEMLEEVRFFGFLQALRGRRCNKRPSIIGTET